jgi:hypothetical protein
VFSSFSFRPKLRDCFHQLLLALGKFNFLWCLAFFSRRGGVGKGEGVGFFLPSGFQHCEVILTSLQVFFFISA